MFTAMRTIICCAGMVSCLASAAATQQPATREGFWIGFGPSYGTASWDCAGGDDPSSICSALEASRAPGLFLTTGATLGSGFLVGADVRAMYDSYVRTPDLDAQTELALASATLNVFAYPFASRPAFARLGLGLSHVDIEQSRLVLVDGTLFEERVRGNGRGWAVSAGLGYDIPVSRKLSVSPALSISYGRPGDVDFDDGSRTTGWTHWVVDLGIGIIFR